MNLGKKEYKSIDVAKFIASLSIVCLHTEPLSSVCGVQGTDFMSTMTRWAIPFFFCSSSFIFFKLNVDIKRYIKRILLLYFVWLIIKINLVYQTFFISDESFYLQLLSFLKGLLFHNTFFASWYLSASVEAMVLLVVLSRRFSLSNRSLLILGILMYIPCLISTSYFGLLSSKMQSLLSLVTFSNSFFVAFIYMVIGKIVAENNTPKIGRSRVLLYMSIVLFIIESVIIILSKKYNQTDSMFVLPILAYFLLCTLVETNNSIPYAITLRKLSILIYLIHPLSMYYFVELQPYCDSITLFFVTLFLSVIFSMAIVKCSERIQLLKYLY